MKCWQQTEGLQLKRDITDDKIIKILYLIFCDKHILMQLIRQTGNIKHAKGGGNNKWGLSESTKEVVWTTWTGAVQTEHACREKSTSYTMLL